MNKTLPDWLPEQGRRRVQEFLAGAELRIVTFERTHRCLLHFLEFQREEGWAWNQFPLALLEDYREGADYLSALRSWLRFLHRRGEILLPLYEEIFSHPPSHRIPRRVPTHDQVLRVLELPPLDKPTGLRDRAMWEVVYAAGLRAGELVAMDVSDVDLAEGTVTVRKAKNTWERVVPLTSWALHYLRTYLGEGRPRLVQPHSAAALWLNCYGWRVQRKRPTQQFEDTYAATRNLGFKVTLHALRHACATRLLENGADLRAVQELLGHREIRNTEIYTRVSPAHLVEVHRRFHPRSVMDVSMPARNLENRG